MLRQKPAQILPWTLLKEATIHFYCLFDESSFSDICTITELKEPNWFCEYMKNVRSSQPCISMNFVLNSVKHKFFPVCIVNYVQVFWFLTKWTCFLLVYYASNSSFEISGGSYNPSQNTLRLINKLDKCILSFMESLISLIKLVQMS